MAAMIPYGRQNVTETDIDAVISTLKSSHLTQGPAVARFETSLAEFLQTPHVVAVANGTAGLHLAYMAADLGPGTGVIMPAMTFAATANAALYCGATPIFADIDPKTLCVDPNSIERAFALAKKAGIKVKAIAPVHFAGLPCAMREIAALAKAHDCFIIEDACHALGASYRLEENDSWHAVGSGALAHMSVMSFHPVKHITTGEGGAVGTTDPELAKRLRILRTHGITKSPDDFKNRGRAFDEASGKVNPWYMEMHDLGFNYRLCDIQAALGVSQLNKLPEGVMRRRQIATQYREAFARMSGIELPPEDTKVSKHSYHLFPLRIDFAAHKKSRADFIYSMREKAIEAQVHYIPVCWHPYYESNSKSWLSDDIDQAVVAYESEISIPMFSNMSDEMVDRVISAVSEWLTK